MPGCRDVHGARRAAADLGLVDAIFGWIGQVPLQPRLSLVVNRVLPRLPKNSSRSG